MKLENRFVRVLDVTVPPFDSTLIHIHENPYAYVSIGPATFKASPILDNDLITVDRLVLGPGESTGRHSHARSSLLVAVHEGAVRMEEEAVPAIRLPMRAGDFEWHTGPLSHTLTNVGSTRFQAIEVVWK